MHRSARCVFYALFFISFRNKWMFTSWFISQTVIFMCECVRAFGCVESASLAVKALRAYDSSHSVLILVSSPSIFFILSHLFSDLRAIHFKTISYTHTHNDEILRSSMCLFANVWFKYKRIRNLFWLRWKWCDFFLNKKTLKSHKIKIDSTYRLGWERKQKYPSTKW